MLGDFPLHVALWMELFDLACLHVVQTDKPEKDSRLVGLVDLRPMVVRIVESGSDLVGCLPS